MFLVFKCCSCPFCHAPLSYSDVIIEREILMQKYIHLVQIMETEKVAANQLRTQLEDQETEIERLKAEVCMSISVCAYIKLNTVTYTGAQMEYMKIHVHKCIRQDEKSLEFRMSLNLKHIRTPVTP